MIIEKLNSKNFKDKISRIRTDNSHNDPVLEAKVRKIVDDVRLNGDEAVFRYTRRFDKYSPTRKNILVSSKDISDAEIRLSSSIKSDLRKAAYRIRTYHNNKKPLKHLYRDNLGNELGWLIIPLERVGIYVPGGKAAYPSTVLMTAIAARVAGVKEIILVTPCPGGRINDEVLYASKIAGVDGVYKVGGAQAISALAYGTASIPKVDKIVGPGNIYVAIAKKLVFGVVDIDMIAGPSEVLIISDGSCSPEWIAADLLAQAEHDEMAIPICITTSKTYASDIDKSINKQLLTLSRRKIADKSVSVNGRIYIVRDLDFAVKVSNYFAPEHLQLCVNNPKRLLENITNAGAIFLGSMSTEAFGDYIAGPSHVLPTGGAAKFSSPLSVYDYVKMPSIISVTAGGFSKLNRSVINLAMSEGLEAHANSVRVRINNRI